VGQEVEATRLHREWYKDAVIYQAHVRAFLDSTSDGVGDFPGLTSRLEYLEGLGIDTLWLLPFYPSPLKDLALAADSTDSGFAPEPFGREDLAIATSRAIDAAARARTVLDARDRLLDTIRSAAALSPTAMKIRIHGDYRLGQVLLSEGDVYIQNVEGHLSWPAAAQREKQSMLKDVASMVRSFSYAAHAALLTRAMARPDQLAPLARWAQAWEMWATASFLRSYYSTAAQSPALPRREAERDTLLSFFMLDRALRELDGELNNRTVRIGIPLSGLLDVLGIR